MVLSDVLVVLLASLQLSLRMTPLVIVVATLVRSVLLLTGRKRAFHTWTRNTLLSVLTIVFAPGMVVNTLIRYLICAILKVDIEGVGGTSTYAEFNRFLEVGKPPHVAVLLTALFVSSVLSVFVSLSLLFIPFVLLMGVPVVLLCWYVAMSVLLNSCIRSGDIVLLGESLKKHGERGVLELVCVIAALALFYTQIVGVVL
jgi:hypothetical protein